MKKTVTLLTLLFLASLRTVSYGASDSKLHLDLFNDGEFIVFVDNIRYQSVRGGIDIAGLNPGTHAIRITEIFRGDGRYNTGRSVLYNGSINIPFRSAVFAQLTTNYRLVVTQIQSLPTPPPPHRGYNGHPRNTEHPPYYGGGSSGRRGGGQSSSCDNQRDFSVTLNWMERASFDREKLEIAEDFARGGIRSSEVATLMNYLDFERNKLAFAKYAYSFTIDKRNYHLVNQSFDFDSSVRELDRFIYHYQQ